MYSTYKSVNKSIFFTFFVIFLLVLNSLNSLYLKTYQKDNFLVIAFYDNISCSLAIKELNFTKNYTKCFDVILLNIINLNLTLDFLELSFLVNNKTLTKKLKINKTNIFNYEIFPKTIKIADKTIINIKTNSEGTLKVLGSYFILKEGENKIDLTNILTKRRFLGKLKVEIELCKRNYCENFTDYLVVERSPIICKISIIKNLFPKYIIFDFKVFDQENNPYTPNIVFFDMDLIPFKENNYYKIIFPKFYPAKEFSIKIKVDGKTCKKILNLDYSNYFYAISDPLEKKFNITKIYIQNPYNSKEKIILYSKVSNKSYLLILKPLETKIIKEKFGTFEVIYKNRTIYSFEPKVISSIYSDFSTYFKSTILALFLFIIFLNIIIFFFGSSK